MEKGQGATFSQEILDFIIENFEPQVMESISGWLQSPGPAALYLNMGFEVVRPSQEKLNGDIHLFVEMEKNMILGSSFEAR